MLAERPAHHGGTHSGERHLVGAVATIVYLIANDANFRAFLANMVSNGIRSMETFVDKAGRWFPDRDLPRDKHGNAIPDTNLPHTQLGTRNGRRGKYGQTREWGEDGRPVKDTDWTDHGRPDKHKDPHDHVYKDNKTGGTRTRGK